MKTIRNIILGFIFTLVIVSCDNPVNLGSRLDLNGPIVNFTSPVPRKAVTASFTLEGTVEDKSGVDSLLIKVEKNREELPRQWRNTKGAWEISDDFGVTWRPLPDSVWDGDKSVVWSIPVDLSFNGVDPEDGEYMFSATALDKGGVSDDNSFKTLILIIDTNPPYVTVINPLLYSRFLTYNPGTDKFNDAALEALRKETVWTKPELIGKYISNSFLLQWNIEDNFNIWSFDLRFYEMNVSVDDNSNTPLSDDYIYRFHQNLPPAPVVPTPENFLKPNGSVTIPSLDQAPGSFGENGELKKSIAVKTTIRVVALCYDAANNVTQEKTLGYFIYWPEADIPWITYSGDLKTPEYYTPFPVKGPPDAFMVYPGRDIKAIAFHAQGVKEVIFSLYKIEPDEDGNYKTPVNTNTLTLLPEYTGIKKINPPRGANNNYSTNFSWDFTPPPRSAFYVLKAKAYSINGKESDETNALFKVQDITFPDFPEPVHPPALDPLWQYIDTATDSITITGTVSDATEITSLCLVWINPLSKNAGANAQLEYFRDAKYEGWLTALTCTPTNVSTATAYKEEGNFDETQPNKVWRLRPTLAAYPNGINPQTQRVEYDFTIRIPLSHLNIGIGKNPLKSQVFMLRAENPSPKQTVITYTPQGDETPPTIEITKARVVSGAKSTEYRNGDYGEIAKFAVDDKITIFGNWKEESVRKLNFNNYLEGNFKVTVNGKDANMRFPPTSLADSGQWEADISVGTGPNDILVADLKDTLVVSAKLTDFGGNPSNDGASWLIKSDFLRLMRISSEKPDQTYNVGKAIDIFIEFNKPVRLKNGGNPLLTLNLTGGGTLTARYNAGQDNQNTRQYFTYTVQSGQSTTPANSWLDVTGLSGITGGITFNDAAWPFTWVSGDEEIRVTTNASHVNGTTLGGNEKIQLRRLPVSTNADDLVYTLARGKNIGIDTAAPTVTQIRTKNKAGHYAEGAEIDIEVTFSEAVKIQNEASPPQLNIQVTNGAATTRPTTGNVKVNDRVVTFTYKVSAGDTTGDNKIIVDSFTKLEILDIAGTPMEALNLTQANRTLNGGTANNGDGLFINTISPGVPTFRALKSATNSTANRISNNLGAAESSTTADVNIYNVYDDQLWFAINGNTTGGNNRLGYLEYSLDGSNWKRIDSTTGTAFQQTIYGQYNVKVRQIDKAGNKSAASNTVSFNWDPGTLVTRIDSSSPNGTYTNTTGNILPPSVPRTDSIFITVYFRKSLVIDANAKITLNALRGTTPIELNNLSAVTANSLTYTYMVGTDDNTPNSTGRDQYLDVTGLSITAKDSATNGVTVTDFIKLPANNDDRLKNRKDILVQTGALAISTGPTYSFTPANDEATGNITFKLNRNITKKGGSVSVTQQNTGYRLPAVLTEAQANRYKAINNFNTYYTKGTNGFNNAANQVDTSTKFVLNYSESTDVTPANTTGTAKLAYDFLAAEAVTLPVSSQDITITGDTLVINLTGSNALQVLGATYNIVIEKGFIQDSLGFQWPTADTTYTYTVPGINKPFARVDKKVNADRITTATGSGYMPWLMANFSNLITTTARLDCRTPNSVVRYYISTQEHTATGATVSSSGYGSDTWRNGAAGNTDDADKYDFLTRPNNFTAAGAIGTAGATPTGYADTATSFTVGSAASNAGAANENITGYIWRITLSSRNGTTGTTNSDLYDEIAFRTVLTYQLDGLSTNTLGERLDNGDQLWIRGGDAVGISSVPGFPINWQDDYGKLNTDKKRAGIRLLRRVSSNNNLVGTNFNTASVWRWVTWEINVRTYHDVVRARGEDTATGQAANDAWQYGPRQWSYQRGGWTAAKSDYTLYPGKHRWVRITATEGYNPGGRVNFSLQFSIRGTQAVSLTQP